jgi:hypothetical protein
VNGLVGRDAVMLAVLTGWTSEPEWNLTVRLQDGRRQSDSTDVGQPTWPYMWAYISMTVPVRQVSAPYRGQGFI